MKKTKLSFYYLAGYLLFGGTGFLFFPDVMLKLFFSTGDYNNVMLSLIGALLLGLAVIVVQIIRYELKQLYLGTLLVRVIILATLTYLYIKVSDPLFLILIIIVGTGFILTGISYLSERNQ